MYSRILLESPSLHINSEILINPSSSLENYSSGRSSTATHNATPISLTSPTTRPQSPQPDRENFNTTNRGASNFQHGRSHLAREISHSRRPISSTEHDRAFRPRAPGRGFQKHSGLQFEGSEIYNAVGIVVFCLFLCLGMLDLFADIFSWSKAPKGLTMVPKAWTGSK